MRRRIAFPISPLDKGQGKGKAKRRPPVAKQRLATIAGITMKLDVDPRKPGKGRPDLNSSPFIAGLAHFAFREARALRRLLVCAHDLWTKGRQKWLLNIANAIVMECDKGASAEPSAERCVSVRHHRWMLAAWCIMLSGEMHVNPEEGCAAGTANALGTPTVLELLKELNSLVQYAREEADLQQFAGLAWLKPIAMQALPPITLQRLGIHQELCADLLGSTEAASSWKTEGVDVARRMGSVKRHFDALFAGKTDEDHHVHLLWNMMAIWHTWAVVRP